MTNSLRRHHGKACYWCQRPMLIDSNGRRPTRDHVTPKAHGGTFIRIACHACNNLKGDMHPRLWSWVLRTHPAIHEWFGRPGPRGMALYYPLLGNGAPSQAEPQKKATEE